MAILARTWADPATYRRLVYLLSALPLGTIWFVALVTVWSLCLGLAITPLVIPLLFALAYITRGFAVVESQIAGSLLGVDAHPPAGVAVVSGLVARLRSLFGPDFWRAQAYLLIRWFIGFPIAVAVVAVAGAVVGLTFAPLWVPFVHGGAQLGIWRPHTFVQSLALVPLGIVLGPLSLLVVNALAAGFAPLASRLLRGDPVSADRLTVPAARTSPTVSRRGLAAHAAADGILVFVLVLIWALTSLGYFWPIWIVLPSLLALAIHGWTLLVAERPALVGRFAGSRSLAMSTGVASAFGMFVIGVWAVTSRGYFWPVWPLLGFALVLAAQTATVLLSSPRHAEMAERIETLETSRAGAVDVQDSELRRIERDLHDGAQARLVALGMSLGMAEQKLSEDPERAGELLTEARAGAEQALRELRDLARGIHPPVLADRGLEAALSALGNSTPLRVTLAVDVSPRPASAVESAAYFAVAEALANAGKHAHAERVRIHIVRIGDQLKLAIEDDGIGGADPEGSGLRGLRRRVQALDGSLIVDSPRGGPTTIRAELPCG